MTPSRRQLLAGAALTASAALAMQAQAQEKAASPPAASPPAAGDEEPLLLFAQHDRPRTTLDGLWAYILDQNDSAFRKPNARRAFWLDEPQKVGGPVVEYDWSISPRMEIPGDWNTRDPSLEWYDGPIYFHRRFQAPAETGGRRFLSFEAVNYHAVVWLNGQEIGRHEGGFTPFVFEVTGKLKAGENVVVLRVDDRVGPETLPSLDFDWKNYGGITRSVWLVETPATFLRDAFLRLEGGQLVADLRADGPAAAGLEVSVAIAGLNLTLSGKTGPDGRARLSAKPPRGLKLWSPETPTLYDVTFKAGEDVRRDRVGFRTLEARGRQILVNGKPRFIRGIALHEEPLGAQGGRVMTPPEARALLEEAKALGCDMVRLAHYPHTESTVRLCDELGLLVWSEIPVYWDDVAYESPRTLALARAMAAEMVVRDRNRASVAFWSVANETPTHQARTTFLRHVVADIRRLDPTRLLTAALNKNIDVGGAKAGQNQFVVDDPLAPDLDVVAINQYEGWYGPRTPDQAKTVRFSNPHDKPMMMSEFGADALYGERGPKQNRWTEEYQAWVFEETLALLDRDGFVGVSPWVLKDFRSPRRWHARYQDYWNRKGLVSNEGHRKLAFETLRRYYAGKAS
jgi:beta-glucuronidase